MACVGNNHKYEQREPALSHDVHIPRSLLTVQWPLGQRPNPLRVICTMIGPFQNTRESSGNSFIFDQLGLSTETIQDSSSLFVEETLRNSIFTPVLDTTYLYPSNTQTQQ